MAGKSEHAFRTIGELARELGVAQHILRYWETRFPQLRPMQRAGNRRYYRPEDVALAKWIHRLLNQDGYTLRGVQQVLDGRDEMPAGAIKVSANNLTGQALPTNTAPDARRLREIRDQLAGALADSV